MLELPDSICLDINGEKRFFIAKSGWTLIQLLRDELGLMGAKPGCTTGNCGACKVLVDGKAVVSCITKPESMVGRRILTIEGLEVDGHLDPLQESFIRHNALQCGFCIPGMIIASKALLNKDPHPTEKELAQALRGNICRCGCYAEIREAILDASKSEKRRVV